MYGGGAAAVNSPFTYTIEVANDGPDDATDVTVLDTLPADVTVTSVAGECETAEGMVSCAF